jgi:hypothetical protein
MIDAMPDRIPLHSYANARQVEHKSLSDIVSTGQLKKELRQLRRRYLEHVDKPVKRDPRERHRKKEEKKRKLRGAKAVPPVKQKETSGKKTYA